MNQQKTRYEETPASELPKANGFYHTNHFEPLFFKNGEWTNEYDRVVKIQWWLKPISPTQNIDAVAEDLWNEHHSNHGYDDQPIMDLYDFKQALKDFASRLGKEK